jgi:HEAT repeat protein
VPPEPQKYLVPSMFKARALSFEEQAELSRSSRSSVAEEARRALLELARTDPQEMEKLLWTIGDGAVSDVVLHEILAWPTDDLKLVAPQLRRLLESKSALVRARVVRALPGGWLANTEALALAQKALQDEAPEVRTAATRVLRDVAER